MKYLVYTLLAISFVFNGCDKCKDVVCINGDCNKGNCDCYDWYEGDKCENEMREKFYGTYEGTLNCDGESHPVYSILSEAGNELNKIAWDSGWYLELTSSTEFTVPEQLVTYDGNIYVLRGSGGSLKYHQITIDFSITYEGYTMYCQYVRYSNYKTSGQGKETIWDKLLE